MTKVETELPVQHRERAYLSPAVTVGMVGIVDVAIIILVGLGFYFGYVSAQLDILPLYLVSLSANVILTVGSFYFCGLYQFDAIVVAEKQFWKMAGICIGVFLIMVVWAFALKISSEFSRIWFFACLFTEIPLILLFRLSMQKYIRKLAASGNVTRKIAIVGGNEQAVMFISNLNSTDTPWNEIIGVFDDRREGDRAKTMVSGVPVLGNILDLIDYSRKMRIDDVVIALPWNAVDRLLTIIKQLRQLPVDIRLASDIIRYEFPNNATSKIANITLLNLVPKPLADWNVIQKSCEDKFFAAMALIIFGPLMALIAITIKLESKGPVFFKQNRYGFNNEKFSVYKFRSMRHERPEEIGVPQATKNDTRVTPVGRVLRRSSLDELPQLFNVIKGDMSMVGPRPHAVVHNEQYAKLIKDYMARHRVKPGITGLAQVNGWRGETDTIDKMENRVRHDIEYIENWSIWLDIKILLKTIVAVFKSENAY